MPSALVIEFVDGHRLHFAHDAAKHFKNTTPCNRVSRTPSDDVSDRAKAIDSALKHGNGPNTPEMDFPRTISCAALDFPLLSIKRLARLPGRYIDCPNYRPN